MANERYSLYPLTVDNGSPINVTQLESFSVSTNTQKSSLTPGGAVDVAHIGVASATPSATFATRDITGLFASISATAGLACTGGATFRMQKRLDGGTFATSTSHETYTSTLGFLRPVSIGSSQEDADGALLNCEYTALWDGTNNPLVHNSSVNFATAPAPAFVSRFFHGPVYHNSSALDSIISWNLDFGINYQARAFNGDPFPRCGAIVTRTPSLTFTTADANVGTTLDMFCSAVSSSFAAYLHKGVAAGTRVAAATTSHTKVTISAGAWGLDESSFSGNDDGTVNFSVMPTGTIALSVASAIP